MFVTASKNVNSTKAVTMEQKEGAQQTSIEKPLTRKQWKNRMKNKRKCKNKYQDKASKSETEQVKESDNKAKSSTPKQTEQVKESDDKGMSSAPKQMDPHNANPLKSKKSRKAEVKRQKQAAEKSSSCIPSSETEELVPIDGLIIDTSNITNNKSNENLSKPSVRSEHLMPSDKRKLKEKQKHADKLRHLLSGQSSEGKPKSVEGKETSTEKDTEGDTAKGEGQILDRSAALRSKMEKRLEAARFRYINEILYTTTSSEAKRMFKQDPKAFEVYHLGFTTQVQHWPENPVDTIISFIRQK